MIGLFLLVLPFIVAAMFEQGWKVVLQVILLMVAVFSCIGLGFYLLETDK